MKTIKFNIGIGENDFYRKLDQAVKFLEKKNQVKIIINLRGRERYHTERGIQLLDKVHVFLNSHGTRANTPNDKNLSVVYNPKK